MMQDLRYALRQLRRTPAFTVTAVLTLALGIGANTAIFTVFHEVLLRSLPVQKPAELVQLSYIGSNMGRINIFGGDGTDYFSYPMYQDLRDKNTVFSGMLADTEAQVGAVWKNQPELVSAELVSGNYFDVLGVGAAAGRTLLPSDDRVKEGSPVVVLSYDYWKTRFASSPAVLNESILINGHPFVIVGVTAPGFHSAINGFKPKLFFPMMMEAQVMPGQDKLADRRFVWLTVVARLKPGVSLATAQAAMTPLWKSLRAEELTSITRGSAKFREEFVAKSSMILKENSKGFSPLRDDLKTPLMILMGMVLLLAAMTCVNLTSLLLVRAAARGREFAVRYALGAARGRVMRQMLIEGLLLGTLGGGLGLLIAPMAASILVRRISGSESDALYSVTPGGAVLWFNIALSLGISLLFSMAPAWQMMKPSLNEGLRQQSASTLGGAQRFRRTAIAIQIGLSVLLLSGAGLFVRTLHKLKAQDMGIATDHLLGFAIDPSLAGYSAKESLSVQNGVRGALAGLPGTKWVGGTTDPVLSGNQERRSLQIEGYSAPQGEDVAVEAPHITPGYMQALGIPLIAGRDLSEADGVSTQKVALVNQNFAMKYFGSPQKALGHYIATGGPATKLDIQIVGVVGDSKHRGVREGIVSTVYLAFAQYPRFERPSVLCSDARKHRRWLKTMFARRYIGWTPKLVVDSMKTMDEQINDERFE